MKGDIALFRVCLQRGRIQANVGSHQTKAGGPQNPEPVTFADRSHLFLKLFALGSGLPEARRNDQHALYAGVAALFDNRGYRGSGRNDHREIDGSRYGRNGGKAFQVEDALPVRIHGKDQPFLAIHGEQVLE